MPQDTELQDELKTYVAPLNIMSVDVVVVLMNGIYLYVVIYVSIGN